ncbi:DNA adenine methylase [Solwaraspora sp. WMMA2065]|uniref:DNA adenine methylase n=1 Tax=Solwaraspora sp. WMMA2065 TaxID=3015166 RepID=UPI00259B1934|nr:DNA adenine methylase [Solwaraspora sp. WMMA2065]WJK33172.1 DNA adenine methylase [Solwaraspora sp. WMMA2065]
MAAHVVRRERSRAIPKRVRPWPADEVLNKPSAITNEKLFNQAVLSPLRYPGAKRQLVPIIESLVRANVPPPRLLLEPFCGGASAALRLLGTGAVQHAVLADADELVSSFWYTAAFHTSWLVNRMMEEEVSVERWDWWRMSNPRGVKERGLKCLFMNRTTFSGILHGWAGPIGGRSQTSEYKIDCRFNKNALATKLRAIGELADTGRLLDVWHGDWSASIARLKTEFGNLVDKDEVLVYLDPPYVEKAPYLYEWSFQDDHHKRLAEALLADQPFRWMLSYDDTPTTRALYPASPTRTLIYVKNRYTAAGQPAENQRKQARIVRDELLVTNFLDVPFSDSYYVVAGSSVS